MSSEQRGPGRTQPQTTTVDVPSLQWANSKSMARAQGTSDRYAPLVGFHVEAGIDADLDAAAVAAKLSSIEIRHQRDGGSEVKEHWYLGEKVAIYPLTEGVAAPTMAACLRLRTASARGGIGVKWPDGERSKIALRCYVAPLVRVGYTGLLQFSARSLATEDMITALLDHYRVCEAADGLIDRAKHPEVVSLYEVALPLGPGAEVERGKGDTATVVPFQSVHMAEVGAEYLRTVWRPQAVVDAALADWQDVQEWAAEFCAGTADGGHDEAPPRAATVPRGY